MTFRYSRPTRGGGPPIYIHVPVALRQVGGGRGEGGRGGGQGDRWNR